MVEGAFDLHTHSRASDGFLAPRELVRRSRTVLGGMAITDHDSVEGVEEALAAGRAYGVQVVPGVELTTDYGQYEVHILAYFIDHRAPVLTARLNQVVEGRVDRARRIVARLNEAGFSLSWEAVRLQSPGPYLGRPHVVRALVATGLVPEERADRFFQEFLAAGRPAFVPHEELSTEEAIGLALTAGGVPVLAHPGRIGTDAILAELVAKGLGGIEVYYPAHTPEDVLYYLRMADKYGLIPTGGSDFHGGSGRIQLGESSASFAAVRSLALRAAGGIGRSFLSCYMQRL